MTKIKNIIAFIAISQILYATDIAVPTPSEMLSQADVVAVAHLSKENGIWTITFKEILKGRYREGDREKLSSPYNEEAFSFDQLSDLVGTDEFLFVGKQQSIPQTLQPIYGICSVWPQGTIEELLPERTLPEVVTYAKTRLGLTGASRSPSKDGATSHSQTPPNPPSDTPPKHSPSSTVMPLLAPLQTAEVKAVPIPSEKSASLISWSYIAVALIAVLGSAFWLLKRRS